MDKAIATVTTERRGAVAIVSIDYAPVNALSRSVRRGIVDAFDALAADTSICAVVIHGGPGRFIAGADLREMNLPPDEPYLPDVVAAIEAVGKPVVALLDGPALGGGLEIALACDVRLASTKAIFGLPEAKLGLIPGAGGTQRLPRLIGIQKAISMVCEGRIVKAAEAQELGIIDSIIEGDLLAQAYEKALDAKKRIVRTLAIPSADGAQEDAAAKQAISRAKGVPAVAEAARIILASRSLPFEAAIADERATFLRLRESEEARALRHLFLAEREAGKVPGIEGASARKIERAAVIGAGTMGAGIAVALADAGLPVALIERDPAAAEAGAARIDAIYERLVAGGRIQAAEAKKRRARILATDDWLQLKNVDLAIEAAYEDMAVKTEIFGRLDALVPSGAILATNTSYLDLDAIAAGTRRPQDVVGLHFFSPANVMKLLEIVKAKHTSPDVLAAALALGRKLGKQAIVAGNCDGFIGNRIYSVYRRHAEYLVEDGATPAQVDAALESYGFAMGIFSVSDMSGLDIAYAMRRRRAATRNPAERYVRIPDLLVEAGHLGRKTGAGWYVYDATGKKSVDPATMELITTERMVRGIMPHGFSDEAIARRLVAVMANEGAKELEEGIAQRASDIDLAFVNGYGFPRWRGGPMFAADRQGLTATLQEVQAAFASGGAGSEPAALLVELARSGGTFAEWKRS